jgi:quercetin dioxygenase-like cupin family protein
MIDVVRWVRPTPPALEELQQWLRSEGRLAELFADPPGMKYGRHKHDFDDFVVVVTGRMVIATDRHEWILNPGDRLDIPAHTVHSAQMLGNDEVSYLSAAR